MSVNLQNSSKSKKYGTYDELEIYKNYIFTSKIWKFNIKSINRFSILKKKNNDSGYYLVN